jgi:membrane-bound lytic murein transglycosylase A
MKKILLLTFVLFSCARAPLEDPAKAFRLSEAPELVDSYDFSSFQDALNRTISAYDKSATIPQEFQFQERKISKGEYLLVLKEIQKQVSDISQLHSFVKQNFDFYEVYGNEEGWGKVFSTGYYDPVLAGSKKRTEKFSQALYKTPSDLVNIDLAAYAEAYPQNETLQTLRTEQKSLKPQWRGRYIAEEKRVVPFYPRAEINAALEGKNLELAWVDPVDATFLQIQGSGLIEFSNGKKMRVGYESQNGYKYEALGKFLYDVIPKEQMSMQRIRQYLNSVSSDEKERVLNLNPSFVFFQELKGLSLTFSGAEVTPHRTIASDQFLFPKGTLNFLKMELPVFADDQAFEPASWEEKPRWVFDQDTGGAIRGGGRIDLYMGQGPVPERHAGVMKRTGSMWVVAPKQEFLEKLRGEVK